MLVELSKYRERSHDLDKSICREYRYRESPLCEVECLQEFSRVRCYRPEYQREHRYTEVESLTLVYTSESIAK